MKKTTKHIILFFTTAGIGNVICLIQYINKKKQRINFDKDINVNTKEKPEEFYFRMWGENLEIAKQYEKDYNLDKSLFYYRLADNSYYKLIEVYRNNGIDISYNTPTRINESKILVKMGKLDEAIEVLNTRKKLDVYKNDNQYRYAIDKAIEDIKKKKEKGYTYKPRKKNTINKQYLCPQEVLLMYEKLAKIAEKDNLTLLFMKAPDKVRAFIMKAENGTYIIVNDKLSDTEKEKAFQT